MKIAEIEELMKRGAWDDAIVRCQALQQVQPAYPRVLGLLGMCHFRKQEWEPAADAFRNALVLDEKFIDAGIKLAVCLERLKRYRESHEVASQLLPKRPTDNTLRGLVELLAPHSDSQRKDSWEQTMRLETKHIPTVGS